MGPALPSLSFLHGINIDISFTVYGGCACLPLQLNFIDLFKYLIELYFLQTHHVNLISLRTMKSSKNLSKM